MNAVDTITTLATRNSARSPAGAQVAPRSIGDILVASGRLSPADLQRILDSQAKNQVPFGEAALALQLLTKDDIDQALSQQFNYAYLSPGNTSLSPSLVAAYQPFGATSENLRAVRSQLVLRWFNGDPARKVLAVVSAGAGEGRSFVAANLAIVFAQQGQRTLLIDADLRAKPELGQHSLFKLARGNGLSAVLADRASLGDAAQAVPGLANLTVLPAGAVPPNPQELLGNNSFGQLLHSAAQQFDVILIDTPAGADFADAELVAARAGAALIVARKNTSLLPATAKLASRLQSSGVALVGSVLNDA
jgi:receptor protein-tyrosine kinase